MVIENWILEFVIKNVNAPRRFDRVTHMKFRIYRNSEADFYHHRDMENLDLHYSDACFEKLLEHGFNGFRSGAMPGSFWDVWKALPVCSRHFASSGLANRAGGRKCSN